MTSSPSLSPCLVNKTTACSPVDSCRTFNGIVTRIGCLSSYLPHTDNHLQENTGYIRDGNVDTPLLPVPAPWTAEGVFFYACARTTMNAEDHAQLSSITGLSLLDGCVSGLAVSNGHGRCPRPAGAIYFRKQCSHRRTRRMTIILA